MSTLGRMFAYAKSAESERLEDFTKALGLPIRAGAEPIYDALGRQRLKSPTGHPVTRQAGVCWL